MSQPEPINAFRFLSTEIEEDSRSRFLRYNVRGATPETRDSVPSDWQGIKPPLDVAREDVV